MRQPNQSISQSSLNTTTQQLVHLSSFQAAALQQQQQQQQQQPCIRKPIINQTQPPKPPERSCSFKDVDNLQQQQQQQICLSPPILEYQPLQNTKTTLSKRQRSMTNKETNIFSMKELQENICEPINPTTVFNNSIQTFQPAILTNDEPLPTRPAGGARQPSGPLGVP